VKKRLTRFDMALNGKELKKGEYIMTYIVDTHALVWFLEGDSRLSKAARNALSDINAQLVIPTIVLAETTFLYAKHRVTIDLAQVLTYITSAENCVIYPLDEIVVDHISTSLDIHDAIIVATALVFHDVLDKDTAVITKDSKIVESRLINIVW
jgi:PIN domain nuclease of toxin-antitoxin system